ncbi:MAG: DUF1573 domain-containing protein [Phycisphaerales bacterium JB038]
MRRTRLLHIATALTLGALVAAPAWGQADDLVGPPSRPIETKLPKIVVEQTELDLGKVPDDRMAETVLRFSNQGEGTLTMRPIRCSCGCTAAKLEKTIYEPGEAGEVTIRFNPSGRRGKQQKTCTLMSNDPQSPSITIKLTCDVMSLVWCEPKNVLVTNSPRGQLVAKQMLLKSRADTFEVVEIQTTNDHVRTELGETKKVWAEDEGKDHFETTLKVIIDGEAPIGFINGELRVIVKATEDDQKEAAPVEGDEALPDVEDEKEDPTDPDTLRSLPKGMRPLKENEHLIRIPVVVQIVGDINAQPRQLRLPVMQVEQELEATFNLISAAGQDFQITGSRLDLPTQETGLAVEIEKLNGGQVGYKVSLVGTAPPKTGMLRGRIVLTTNIEGEEEKIVPFYGSVRPKR